MALVAAADAGRDDLRQELAAPCQVRPGRHARGEPGDGRRFDRVRRRSGREAIYDAEHYFDGYKDDPAYAVATLRAARDAGASTLVLCDTNGGTLTEELVEIVRASIGRAGHGSAAPEP